MKHRDCATWLACSGLLMALFSLTAGRATTGDAPADKTPTGKADETVAAELAAIAKTGPQGAGSAAAQGP